ncbi:hypothetical protein PTTG_25079 [Puccinia triticina 1-1 BBBD Race 1]|uniref:Uncharacterized protein n=1 Tax=Puccinia triticina (isolate 1-1 / race 1 (BBBD)) TaxID=630390 RepID=A0A180H4B8_PUCT1|nr:hypothetical protein PTTG_25079 [Puccinia triticina 1-1 BBBD Race 1]
MQPSDTIVLAVYIRSEANAADFLTKPVGRVIIRRALETIGIKPSSQVASTLLDRSMAGCQDSGLAPEQRKRKEQNPNPARGNATSPHDEEPKRSKRSTPPKSSKLTPKADSDRNGSSLIDRISSSTSAVPARFALVSVVAKALSLIEHKQKLHHHEHVTQAAQAVNLLVRKQYLLGKQVDLLAEQVDLLAEQVDLLAEQVDLLAEQVDLLAEQVDLLAEQVDLLAEQVKVRREGTFSCSAFRMIWSPGGYSYRYVLRLGQHVTLLASR